ncbi:hypothetical protein Tco_1455630 [Tanacetum coccineum]
MLSQHQCSLPPELVRHEASRMKPISISHRPPRRNNGFKKVGIYIHEVDRQGKRKIATDLNKDAAIDVRKMLKVVTKCHLRDTLASENLRSVLLSGDTGEYNVQDMNLMCPNELAGYMEDSREGLGALNVEHIEVASTRKAIDDKRLLVVNSKTRWIKSVPIKILSCALFVILAWSLLVISSSRVIWPDSFHVRSLNGGLPLLSKLIPMVNGALGSCRCGSPPNTN